MRGCCLPRRSLGDNRAKAGWGGRRGGREASMRDETVFRVTNSGHHANPSSDRVFFRRRCNDSMFQRITTARLDAETRPHSHRFPLATLRELIALGDSRGFISVGAQA
jgi:hypothetical protein